MKFIFGTLRPGKVLEVIENGNGSIKASAPGLFSEEDDHSLLPPVYPFPIGHANSFSSPKVGDEVWVLSYSDNPLQLHWFRKDHFIDNDKDFPIGEEGENVEIVVNRNYGDDENPKWATIYFSNGSGWIIKEDQSIINIKPDGSILLKTNFDKRIIDICKDSIALGAEGKAEDNAMLFSKWEEWANGIVDYFTNTLMPAASANPYTMNLAPVFGQAAALLKPKITPVKSEHVTITSN